MPVQIAYDMPSGNARTASASSPMLKSMATTIAAEGASLVNPCEYLRATTHAISKAPARNR